MDEGYLLGIDVGTTNVKVVLVDRASLCVVHKHSQLLGELEKVDLPNAVEVSVARVFHALESCMRSLETTELLGKVRVIEVCGQMHGCVLWNSNGVVPLFNESIGELQHTDIAMSSNLITWQDARCTPSFLDTLPRIPLLTHPPVRAGYGCATLAWLQRHDSEALSRYDRAGSIMDMVVCALSSGGRGEVMMSSQNAASWGYFDVSTSQWHKEILKGLFPVRLLPSVVSVPATAGHLMAAWHGIPGGTTVAVAMGDLQCSIYAAQPTASDAILNLGSASQLALVEPYRMANAPDEAPRLPDSVLKLPYFDGDHLLVAAALGGGNAISKFVATLQGWLKELGLSREQTLSFEDIYEKVMQSSMEKLGTTLQVDPKLWGERHAPEERGRVWDMAPDNLSLGDVGSAMVRGVVKNLHTMMSPRLLQHYQVNRVLGSGQTLQRHRVFQEHIQRVFGLPLDLREEADAPLGAAMAVAHI